MALIDELREKLKDVETYIAARHAQIREHGSALEELERQRWDLDTAIAALEPPPAAVTEPEPEPEPQDDASEFAGVSESKPFRVYSERGDVAGVTSFDTITQARAFANEEISLDAKKIEVFSGDDRLFEWPVSESEPLADPIWNEPEPTDPQADALAKAADYYSPEAVAERNKFNPFAMFRKEGDQ